METNNKPEQTTIINTFVTIVIAVGIVLASILLILSLLNSWSMFGYAEWEFQPFLSREGVKELFHSVHNYLLLEMLVSIVATACIIFFLVKLLQGKRYGFWGFAVTSVVGTAVQVVLEHLIVNAFREIEVDLPHNIPMQVGWTLATIAILYAVLQTKKNGVSCWKQLE